MLLRSTKAQGAEHRIYLGRTAAGAIVHMPPPIFQGQIGSDTYICTGMTGSGKSMITRLLAAQTSPLRMVWILDSKGRDHYRGYFPNRQPKNLPPGMPPRGFKAHYFYYGIKDETGKLRSRARACGKCGEASIGTDAVCAKCGHRGSYEISVKPDFSKYSFEQVEAMGFSVAASKNLKDIMAKYKPFRSIATLQDFIEKHPTTDKDRASKAPRKTLHSKKYREGEFIRSDSLLALTRDFRLKVAIKDVWAMNKKHDVDIEALFLSGKNAVFSFNDTILARAETDYIVKQLEQLADKYPDITPPLLIIEEAHEVFNDETLVDFFRTSRKQRIGMANTLPTLEPFNKKETSDVASDTKQWIVGKLKGFNKGLAIKFIDHPATILIPRLRLDRQRGIREFLYFNGDRDEAYGPFEAFECPQEYNRRV